MENFNQFQIESPEVIFGGDFEKTVYECCDGYKGRDFKDDGVVIFLPPE